MGIPPSRPAETVKVNNGDFYRAETTAVLYTVPEIRRLIGLHHDAIANHRAAIDRLVAILTDAKTAGVADADAALRDA